jgi:hypothetical protein
LPYSPSFCSGSYANLLWLGLPRRWLFPKKLCNEGGTVGIRRKI